MKILLTVTYLFDADRDDLWDKSTRYPTPQVASYLKKRFPKKITLSDTVHGLRYCLTYKPIGGPNANLITCPVCKRLLTDGKKPNPIRELEYAAELSGVQMCKSCAWELERDVETDGIARVMDQFKD